MTKQEIFDRAYEHLMSQMEKSLDDDDGCVYRSEDGLKCAIGGILPDRLYCPEIEDLTVVFLPEEIIEYFGGWNNIPLLTELQKCHDDFKVEQWQSKLEEIAAQFNLHVPTLT